MAESHEVIRLELARGVDLFDTPAVELGATFGSSISGIDRCLAELTGGKAGPPITILGLLIVALGGTISADDPIHDIVGWVFAWLGLW